MTSPAGTRRGTKPRKQLLLLLPPADKIAMAYGVDQARALRIQAATGTIFELFGDLIEETVELIEGQAKTAKLIDKQTRQSQNAGQIREDTLRFLSGDPVPVEHVLKMVFTEFWRAEFVKLGHDIKIELFASLSKAINSLEEPEKDKE